MKIQFTLHERDLLLNVLSIEPEIEDILKLALVKNDTIRVDIEADDLELLLGAIAADANHAPNKKLEKELDALFDRLNNILDSHS